MSEGAVKTRKINKTSEIICFIIALLFMFGFRFLPAVDPITPYGMALLGVFIGMVFGWCTLSDTLPTSLFAVIAFGISTPGGVVGGLTTLFSAYVPLLLVVSFFSIGALMGSGATEWLVYKVCTAKFAAGKPWVLMIVIFFGTWIVGSATNIMIVALFMYSILSTLYTQAGFQPGDKTPVMLTLTLSCGYLLGMILYPWGPPQVMVIQALAGIGIEVSAAKYIITVIITAFLVMGIGLVLMKMTGCEVERFTNIDFTFLQEKYAKGLSAHQKGVLAGILIMCFGNLLISFFPQSFGLYTFVSTIFGLFGWMLVVSGAMLFIKIDGKRLLSPGDMAKYFSWDIFFIISLGVTIGTALTSAEAGIGVWLNMILGPVFASVPSAVVAILVAVVCLVLTNFLNNNVVVIMVAMTLVALAGQGILADPLVLCLVTVFAGNLGFYTPAASFVGALNHTQSHSTPASVYKYGAIVFATLAVFCAIILPILIHIIF